MSAPTLAPAVLSTHVDTFAHQPWCTEHWDVDDDVCWATDIELRVRPDAGGDRGRITVVMTHGTRPEVHVHGGTVNITVFADTVRDGEGSVEFDPDEAEVAAHALLAAVSLSRGETSAHEWHRDAAERMASELLARREAGAR